MRLGIDLDNTLICYDGVFLECSKYLGFTPETFKGGKREIKNYLHQRVDGEKNWQKLQGQVYGRWINNATLYSGAYRFLWRCKARGFSVEIISHKSEYGHFDDENVPLRNVAIDFLTQAGIYSSNDQSMIDNIQFCSSQEEKILCISEKNFDWFVDDLPEIFKSKQFPIGTKRIIFDPTGEKSLHNSDTSVSWSVIESRVLGDWTKLELKQLALEVCKVRVDEVVSQEGRGNSGIFRVTLADRVPTVLKIYPDDGQHNRLHSEYTGLELLNKCGIKQIVQRVACSPSLNVGMYQWIDGKPIGNPSTGDIVQALSWVSKLHAVRTVSEWRSFPSASAAVFSGIQLEEQIECRFSKLNKESVESKELGEFLEGELRPIADKILKWGRTRWPKSRKFGQQLSLEERTLSPSDFGFHNALRRNDGSIVFLDFEYFGWDDPVKLIVDFTLHPGMNLANKLKTTWVHGALEIFGSGVRPRLEIMWPYLGICWCLILLNEFREDVWLRRTRASYRGPEKQNEIMLCQLEKSRNLLSWINLNYREFPF